MALSTCAGWRGSCVTLLSVLTSSQLHTARRSPRCRPMGWNAMRPSRSVCPVSVRSSLPSPDHSLAVASVAPEASVTAASMRPGLGAGGEGETRGLLGA